MNVISMNFYGEGIEESVGVEEKKIGGAPSDGNKSKCRLYIARAGVPLPPFENSFRSEQRLTLTPPTRVERNNVCKQCRNETITRRFFDVSSCCCSFLFFFYLLTNPSCRNMAPPCLLFRYLSPIGESFCRTFCVNV